MLPQTLYALTIYSDQKVGSAGPYIKLDLKTQAGSWPANIWDYDSKKRYPKRGEVLKINKYKDQTDTKHGNIVIHAEDIEYINIENVPEELKTEIIQVPQADKKLIEKSWQILTSDKLYENVEHYNFVQHCLNLYKEEDLCKHPAAKEKHHHYQGGWVVHVSEVVRHARNLCQSVKTVYPFIDNDVVVASAVLHDLGKLETYYIDDLGLAATRDIESSIGHFYYAMEIVRKVSNNFNISKKFIEEVLHCIASHHGSIEYGSYKPVMSLEALVVSMADKLSSQCGIIETKIKELQDKTEIPDIIRIYDEKLIITQAIKKVIK